MDLKERVYSVLLVSSGEKFNDSLLKLLPETKYTPIHIVDNISAAKRIVLERFYDFVIVNTPLPDEFGTRFAIDVCSEKGTVALLLVKNDMYGETTVRVVNYGVLTLPKPISVPMISQALDWMCSTRERLRKLEKKSLTIEEKMNEIRLVNRAKWILIESLKMTEEDAHHFIERQAMDNCTTKKEIAENIIKTYS
ncbi:MAG: ANTAR domain-containing response regulator [Lachnospiraceae bacterium]